MLVCVSFRFEVRERAWLFCCSQKTLWCAFFASRLSHPQNLHADFPSPCVFCKHLLSIGGNDFRNTIARSATTSNASNPVRTLRIWVRKIQRKSPNWILPKQIFRTGMHA